VIAGGQSTRLQPLTNDRPKTMIEVQEKPILYWILNWLKKYHIQHIVLAVGYKKEKIIEFMENNRNFGLDADFSEDKVPNGGTAHAFKCAIDSYIDDENFVGMNSDELTDMDLSRLMHNHETHKPLVTMGLSPFHCRFSVVKQDGPWVTDFEYGEKLWSVPVSMGVYAFNKEVKSMIPETGSIEDQLFTSLAKQKNRRILGDMLDPKETWVSVNTHKDVKEADAFIKRLNGK
jgi:NDP-sugar pyrophosphorylase family protein